MNDIKRIIVMILGATLLILLCLWVKENADANGWEAAYKYHIAIPAERKNEFNYDVDSKQGLVITRGEFNTASGVSFGGLHKKYTYIEKIHERYTMHTYTYPCGKSTCVGHYWSWDIVGSESKVAKKTTYFGREYNADIFGYGSIAKRLDGYYNKTSLDRYFFIAVPLQFTASFITDTSGDSITHPFGGKIQLDNRGIVEMKKDSLSYKFMNDILFITMSLLVLLIAFWAAWLWVMEDGEFSTNK